MFYIKREGKRVENGFNFYSIFDKNSAGVVIRYGDNIPGTDLGDKIFIFRYAKMAKKWIIKELDFKEIK